MALSTRRALIPFLVLFAALYAGFGLQSPCLPALMEDRGVRLEGIGIVLAAGTALRLVAGPAGGRLADRLDAAKLVFAGCAGAASLMALLYLTAEGFWPLFAVSLLQAAALAPLAPLCDSLALGAAAPARRDDAAGPGRIWLGAGCRLQRLHCRGATVRANRGALRPRGGHLA
jgi:MFS transporter, PPP family, 3-phenylpropionic acid transporter